MSGMASSMVSKEIKMLGSVSSGTDEVARSETIKEARLDFERVLEIENEDDEK